MDDEEDYSSDSDEVDIDSSSYSSAADDEKKSDAGNEINDLTSNSSSDEKTQQQSQSSSISSESFSDSYSMSSPVQQHNLNSPETAVTSFSRTGSYSNSNSSYNSSKASPNEKKIIEKKSHPVATAAKLKRPSSRTSTKVNSTTRTSIATPKLSPVSASKNNIVKRAAVSCEDPEKQTRERQKTKLCKKERDKQHKLIVKSIRRPGGVPSTRLPPTTTPFVTLDGSKNKNRLTRAPHPVHVVRKNNSKSHLNPKSLTINHIDSNTVRLKWDSPLGIQPESFRVMVSENYGKSFFKTITTRSRSADICGLEPNTTYHGTVLSVFDEAMVKGSSTPKRHVSIHFVTRPLPQLHTDSVHLLIAKTRNSIHPVVSHRYGCFYVFIFFMPMRFSYMISIREQSNNNNTASNLLSAAS